MARPETWCHPDRPYRAKGQCIDCYQKMLRARRPDIYVERYRRAALKRVLVDRGFSQEEYERMLALQGGVCAICAGPPIGKTRLSIDHDHKTNQVRGLLCDPCNRALGYFQDRPDLCVLGADYLLGASLHRGAAPHQLVVA